MSKGQIKTEMAGFSPFGSVIMFMLLVTLIRSLLVVVKYEWAVACDKPLSICWLVLVGYVLLGGLFGAIKEIVEGGHSNGR